VIKVTKSWKYLPVTLLMLPPIVINIGGTLADIPSITNKIGGTSNNVPPILLTFKFLR